jgi:TolB-like protein
MFRSDFRGYIGSNHFRVASVQWVNRTMERRDEMKRGGFFHEMRRRRVWQVAGAYVVLGWVIVEIVLETFPLLGFPDWVPMVAVVVAYVGFPVTVLLAWVFDITPQGVVLTPALGSDSTGDEAPPARVVVQPRPALLAGVFGAGMVVALVAAGAYSAIHPEAQVRPETIQAIAVLPFADLSAERDQQHFADGMAEELINRLGRIGELRVAARTSSFEFKGTDATLSEIGRRLRVDAVVEGSVRRDGDRLRVTVEVVDVATGFQVWSERYDRTVDDVFAIQDDISGAIVDALRLHLMPEATRLAGGTESLRAHDAYLLGLARWHRRTEADLLRARDYFRQAVAEDENFALAHAGLALTYATLPVYSDIPAGEAIEEGYGAAARALALNAHLAEAHAAIGQIAQGLEWDLPAAEVAYRRALEAQPSYATAHQWYAETLLMLGRLGEARREADRALELDPLAVAARYVRAYLLVVERDFDGARSAFLRMLEESPDFRFGQVGLVLLCMAAGCSDDAVAAARLAYPAPVAEAIVQVLGARSDPSLRPAALAALRSLHGEHSAVELALFHAALDDRDGALALLARGYQARGDPAFPLFLVHPLLDGVREDPGFRRIADAIGIEAPAARLAIRAPSGRQRLEPNASLRSGA